MQRERQVQTLTENATQARRVRSLFLSTFSQSSTHFCTPESSFPLPPLNTHLDSDNLLSAGFQYTPKHHLGPLHFFSYHLRLSQLWQIMIPPAVSTGCGGRELELKIGENQASRQTEGNLGPFHKMDTRVFYKQIKNGSL